MPALTVTIDARSRRRYGVRGKEISFEELRRRIVAGEGRIALNRAAKVATATGLSKLSAKDIAIEIKAARNASRRH